jgi:hypothetical protein
VDGGSPARGSAGRATGCDVDATWFLVVEIEIEMSLLAVFFLDGPLCSAWV